MGIIEWCVVLGMYSKTQRREVTFRRLNGYHYKKNYINVTLKDNESNKRDGMQRAYVLCYTLDKDIKMYKSVILTILLTS